MRSGIIAKKVGMTRLFDEDGRHIPVTVLEVSNCQVTQVKTDETDGYSSVQLGAFNQKQSRVSKPLQGHFAKAKVEPKSAVVEFRTDADHGFEVGAEVKADHFQAGQFVDIAGITNGKGFAGAMKRWNFGGLRATHGVSISHRSHGATGQCQDPGKVFKGKKMAGQMGNKRQTQQNLKVVRIDTDRNVILVKGSVPGAKGSVVEVRDAVKKPAPAAQN